MRRGALFVCASPLAHLRVRDRSQSNLSGTHLSSIEDISGIFLDKKTATEIHLSCAQLSHSPKGITLHINKPLSQSFIENPLACKWNGGT